MQPFADRAVYVNVLEDALEEGEQRVREAYGANYERLVDLKKKYDELARHLIIRRQRRLGDVAFEARVDAELALRSGRSRNGDGAHENDCTDAAKDRRHVHTIHGGRTPEPQRPSSHVPTPINVWCLEAG